MTTTEQAINRLGELGYEVLNVNEIKRIGWTVEAHGDGWGAFEVYEISNGLGANALMALSGRMDTPEQAASWLATYLEKANGAP